MKIVLIAVLFVILLQITGCSDDKEDEFIVPIEEGNYWIYEESNDFTETDTLHYVSYNGMGPDSLGNWFWIYWSSYEGDPPVAIAKNKEEGYCIHWLDSELIRNNMYDIMGRKTDNPQIAINNIAGKNRTWEYILYKYPVDIDEKWILFTSDLIDENGNYVGIGNYTGTCDLSTDIDVSAGKFHTIRYTYRNESADPEEPLPDYLLNSANRSYCKPGIGNIANEYTEDLENWIRWDELSEYLVE